MKRLVILLAVLFAAPAFALTIEMVESVPGVVTVQYSGADSGNPPRAFALDFTIDSPGTITLTPGSYKTDGENVAGDPQAYGIYPARIVINESGDPCDYGSPLADDINDPGAGNGDGSGHVVLEFGSLYVGDGNKPGTSGTLCTLTIACNSGENLNLRMVDEETYRGGILLEDGTAVDVDQTIVVCGAVVETCRDKFTPTEQALWDRYVAAGKDPNSWCWQFQCRGDGDNAEEYLLFTGWLRIYNNDMNVLGASWGLTPETGADPVADYDHAEEYLLFTGWLSVYNNDMNVLGASWADTTGELTDCPSYIAP
jgi:hypothetical protein